MIEVPIFFWRYARVLTDKIEPEEIARLKYRYDYIFLIVYGEKPTLVDFQIQERQVPIIDLSGSLDKVWQKFRHNTRNEIRRVETDKRLSFVSLDININRAYDCYSRFERARRWKPALKSEFKNSLIFSAYYNKRVVAGIACYVHNDIIRVSKIFSLRNYNDEAEIENAVVGQVTRKLVWQICRYGKERGYSRLDLGGVNFTDPAKMGISQFKQSFGGEIKNVYVCRYSTKSFSLLKNFLSYFGKDIT